MKNLIFAGLSAVMLTATVLPVASAMETGRLVETPSQQIALKDNVVAAGELVTVESGHPTAGTVRIIEENGTKYLELDANFETIQGPAVQVVLYTGDHAPVALEHDSYAVIGDLQAFSGAQRFEIPATVNLDNYESVAIWCAAFNVTFGAADI